MKISCGETSSSKWGRLESWHTVFCWLPKKVGEEDGRNICVWLEKVERRYYGWGLLHHDLAYCSVEYRRIL